jgi:hypothetical protein
MNHRYVIYMMTVTNKRLLISESHGDSNWCTPCSGKPDQHDTYTFYTSPRTHGVCFLHTIPVRGNLSHNRQQIWTDPLPQEEGILTQSTSRRLTDPQVHTQFSPTTANEVVGKSQDSIDNRLLGLSDPYHWHAVSTFNTCSRGSTHQSLTDSSGGYSFEGTGYPHSTPWPSQPTVFTFHLRAPLGLRFN